MYEVVKEIRDIIENACGARFKRYSVGSVRFPIKQDLPLVAVYGTQTILSPTGDLTTCKDKYRYSITIDVYSNVYENVSSKGTNVDDVAKTSQQLSSLIEKRTTDNVPDADTVLGAIRRLPYLRGNTFLFTDDIVIDYTEEQIAGASYHKASITLSAVNYNTRT